MMELSLAVAKAGFEKAQNEVPYFTEMLFTWAHDNKYEEALKEFLACFVEGAMTESMSTLSRDLLAIKNKVKRDEVKKKRVEIKAKKASEAGKEDGGDE